MSLKKSRPSGRETAKCSDAVKFVSDKVVKQMKASLNDVNSNPAPLWGTLEKSLLEANSQTRMIAKQSKFERFILKRTINDVPFSWDLLDETGRQVVEQIVKDKDQGPSKEWGQYGWY
jgi:hypothetical protein